MARDWATDSPKRLGWATAAATRPVLDWAMGLLALRWVWVLRLEVDTR